MTSFFRYQFLLYLKRFSLALTPTCTVSLSSTILPLGLPFLPVVWATPRFSLTSSLPLMGQNYKPPATVVSSVPPITHLSASVPAWFTS